MEAQTTIAVATPVEYPITEQDIAAAAAKYAAITFDTPEHYEEGRKAIAQLRSTRTAIEERRVALKAGALEYGRKVDAVAKQLTKLVSDVEEPLKAKKKAVDDEEARLKREAEKAELLALEARLKAEREAAEEVARVARQAEEARLADERKRLAEQEAKQAEERRVSDERQRAEDERLRLEREELDRQRAQIEALNAAARAQDEARLEAERVAREKVEREQREAAEAARLEALRPDIEKIHAYGMAVRVLIGRAPDMATEEGTKALAWATGRLNAIATALDAYPGK